MAGVLGKNQNAKGAASKSFPHRKDSALLQQYVRTLMKHPTPEDSQETNSALKFWEFRMKIQMASTPRLMGALRKMPSTVILFTPWMEATITFYTMPRRQRRGCCIPG
jgi:hypothetical protein